MLIPDILILMVVISCLYFVLQTFGIGRCLLPVFSLIPVSISLHKNFPKKTYYWKNL